MARISSPKSVRTAATPSPQRRLSFVGLANRSRQDGRGASTLILERDQCGRGGHSAAGPPDPPSRFPLSFCLLGWVNPLAFRRSLQGACDTIAPCSEYRRAAHTVYAFHYHFVFITKYRKPVLRGEIGTEVRDLIREICRTHDIEILQGHIRPDHVHLLLSVPAAPGAESGHAGDQGKDVPSSADRITGSCGRSIGVGTCGHVATSCAAAAK